jgi:hypothetical protein
MSKTNRREFIKKVAYVVPTLSILGSLKAEAHSGQGVSNSILDPQNGNKTIKQHKHFNKS